MPRHPTIPSIVGEVATAAALGIGLFLVAFVLACEPTPATRHPALGEVVSRVDFRRVLECAGRPDRWACLGATAASAALDLAADRAEAAARAAQQALSGAGADDVDEDAVALELEAALADLNLQLAGGR